MEVSPALTSPRSGNSSTQALCQLSSASGLQLQRPKLTHPWKGLGNQQSPRALGQEAAFPQGSQMREGCELAYHRLALVPSGSHHGGSLSNQEARVLQGREPGICQPEHGKPSPSRPAAAAALGPGAGLAQESPTEGGEAAGAGPGRQAAGQTSMWPARRNLTCLRYHPGVVPEITLRRGTKRGQTIPWPSERSEVGRRERSADGDSAFSQLPVLTELSLSPHPPPWEAVNIITSHGPSLAAKPHLPCPSFPTTDRQLL